MREQYSFRIYGRPGVQRSSLVVGWREDAGNVGAKVVDYLNHKLGGREFGEIEPVDFFALGGVSVEDDVAEFPESRFVCCERNNLVLFGSNLPRFDWYRFLNAVLDVAEHYCHAQEVYTVGGMVTLSAHSAARDLLIVANSPEMRKFLGEFPVVATMDFETPRGQRPTLSSFLLWTAKRRNIRAASLWVPVPFYLAAHDDPRAWKKIIEFLDRRFGLGINSRDLDDEIEMQDNRIAEGRRQSALVDLYITKLEQHLALTQEESEQLIGEMRQLLAPRGQE